MGFDTVIVGAGASGLTAAAYLAKYGHSVLLCEKEAYCGGLINSFTRDGFTFDGGIRALEDAGAVEKTYLAVVHGRLDGVLSLGRELDVADRAVTRVLDRDTADPLRRTQVTPVREAGGLTLVRCRIAKGARHQIRAHLAAAGHPLVGDPVYGHGEGERLFLHCAAIVCPVLEVAREAPWELTAAVAVCGGRQKPSQDQA